VNTTAAAAAASAFQSLVAMTQPSSPVSKLMQLTCHDDASLCLYALKRNGNDVSTAAAWMSRLGLSKAPSATHRLLQHDEDDLSDDGCDDSKLDALIEALVDDLSSASRDDLDNASEDTLDVTPEKSEVLSSCDASPESGAVSWRTRSSVFAAAPTAGAAKTEAAPRLVLPESDGGTLGAMGGIVAEGVARMAITSYLMDGLMVPMTPGNDDDCDAAGRSGSAGGDDAAQFGEDDAAVTGKDSHGVDVDGAVGWEEDHGNVGALEDELRELHRRLERSSIEGSDEAAVVREFMTSPISTADTVALLQSQSCLGADYDGGSRSRADSVLVSFASTPGKVSPRSSDDNQSYAHHLGFMQRMAEGGGAKRGSGGCSNLGDGCCGAEAPSCIVA